MIAWDFATTERQKRVSRSQPLTKQHFKRAGFALLALSLTAGILIAAVQFNWFWLQ